MSCMEVKGALNICRGSHAAQNACLIQYFSDGDSNRFNGNEE
jgi:hypothetical protein